jgi:hypothetical protein
LTDEPLLKDALQSLQFVHRGQAHTHTHTGRIDGWEGKGEKNGKPTIRLHDQQHRMAKDGTEILNLKKTRKILAAARKKTIQRTIV